MSFGPAQRIPTQVLTYWARSSLGSDNEYSYAAPILVQGRWTEKRVEVQNAQGEIIVSNTQVIVDRDMLEGEYLAKGDQRAEVSPTGFDGAQEVQGFTSTPDLRYNEQVRRAYL